MAWAFIQNLSLFLGWCKYHGRDLELRYKSAMAMGQLS
jgi:hypothetical protein